MDKATRFAGTILTSLSIVLIVIGCLLVGQNARAQNPPPNCTSLDCIPCPFDVFLCSPRGQELGACNFGECPPNCTCPDVGPNGNGWRLPRPGWTATQLRCRSRHSMLTTSMASSSYQRGSREPPFQAPWSRIA